MLFRSPVPGGMAGKWFFHSVMPEGTIVKTEEIHVPDVQPADMRMQIKEGFLSTAGDRRNDK